ncbi:hypothetical protein BDP27DRAFT_1362232 [Rhodocollybia butyracea]|uniref:Uncharacterized protein n=1 Tax=Rhodocollybia butyracea TaxID=206335 RepID=A0A9P5PZR3_9AGAR|nr:hypothetical protein BDP27DRAFT_1362232 [Rhodocollybia butyracea]
MCKLPLEAVLFGLKYLEGCNLAFRPYFSLQPNGFSIKGPENYTETISFAQSVEDVLSLDKSGVCPQPGAVWKHSVAIHGSQKALQDRYIERTRPVGVFQVPRQHGYDATMPAHKDRVT